MSDKMRKEFEEWGSTHEIRSALDVWMASRESQVIDLDSAAKALAESMDYPWEFMSEQGRARMRANARMVIEAAGLKVKP